MKYKTFFSLLLVFLFMNFITYYMTEQNIQNKTNIVIQENQNTLSTHYNILLESQKHISYAIYKSILRNTDAVELLEQSYKKPKEVQAQNRKKLYAELVEQYKTAKQQGILQLQFVFKDNISFLRVHKPNKFDDDLSEIREDFKQVNITKKPIRAFTPGRTSHGFRNTFPIFNKNNKHIGAIEISFTSDSFQCYLNNVSHIHSHFLIYKDIFNFNAWKRDDMISHYTKSSENKDYMLNLSDMHTREICIEKNAIKLASYKKMINEKMKRGKSFGFFVFWEGKTQVISFLPIQGINAKSIAWIISYKNSPIIAGAIKNTFVTRIIVFLLSLVIIYFLVLQIKAKEKVEEQNLEIQKKQQLLHDLLNLTDNIIFVTDFKKIKYANNRFKNLLNIEHTKNINQKMGTSLLEIFVEEEGCLSASLLNDGEDFPSLVTRTEIEDRVVMIIDKFFIPKAFKISILKTENNGDYLVTLTDITQMRHQHKQTVQKAYIDGLTKIFNRNKFDEMFLEKFNNAKNNQKNLSVAILDIDKFKDFNDNYGHLIGDEVLVQMAQSIQTHIRESDVFARWGGEEFVILFTDTPVSEAKIVAEKLRRVVSKNKHPKAGHISASFGVSDYREGDTVESIFKRCDEALYIAKSNGRNRVEVL